MLNRFIAFFDKKPQPLSLTERLEKINIKNLPEEYEGCLDPISFEPLTNPVMLDGRPNWVINQSTYEQLKKNLKGVYNPFLSNTLIQSVTPLSTNFAEKLEQYIENEEIDSLTKEEIKNGNPHTYEKILIRRTNELCASISELEKILKSDGKSPDEIDALLAHEKSQLENLYQTLTLVRKINYSLNASTLKKSITKTDVNTHLFGMFSASIPTQKKPEERKITNALD